MLEEAIERYAREHLLSRQDAYQAFVQVILLKNITLERACLIGGGALVLGHSNPRFSEDLDFTQVVDPLDLKGGLHKAAREAGQWLGKSARLTPPKPSGTTWKLLIPITPAETIRVHIDSQPYRAMTHFPMVIRFPSIPAFVASSVQLEEIMADKLIALAYRRYLGGRDLFDLWFHWLSRGEGETVSHARTIQDLLAKKLKQRKIKWAEFSRRLADRLSERLALEHAREEWKRYLPPSFQEKSVEEEIMGQAMRIPTYLFR